MSRVSWGFLLIAALVVTGCDAGHETHESSNETVVTTAPQQQQSVGTLPAYPLPGERTKSGKADQFDDYRLANPQYYAITEPTNVSTPNYRHMVEWEEMQSLFITYSDNMPNDPAGVTLAGIAAETVLKANTPVYVVVSNNTAKNSISNRMINNFGITQSQINNNVTFFTAPNDSIWFIDYGPVPLVRNDGAVAFGDFRYYHQRVLDDGLTTVIGNELGVNTFRMPIDTEGGTFQGDGQGTCFTGVRGLTNAGMTEAEFKAVWQEYLNCDQLVVMKDISDDGTGHIDMFFKLVDTETAIIGEYKSPYVVDNFNENNMDFNTDLVNATSNLVTGENINVVRMPFPSKSNGVPRTYINSTFVNGVNLWPVYSNSLNSQAEALQVWQSVMPGWEHVGINSDQIASYSGTIHCVSRTIPEGDLIPWIADGTCTGGTCSAGEFGYTGTCNSTIPCSGPEWLCETNECDPNATGGSCVGACGGQSGNCYCDAQCQQYGDCCSDYEEVCLGTTTGGGEEGGPGGEEGGPTGCPDGLTYEGCCDGNTLTWCEGNTVETINCQTGCGIWNSGQSFYDCFQDGDSQPVPDPSGTFPVNCDDNGEGGTEGGPGGEEGGPGGEEGGPGGEEGGVEGEEGGTEGTAGGEEGGGPDSCVGNCGGPAPSGCYCDDLCQQYGDCCSDYEAVCLGQEGGTGGEEGGPGGEEGGNGGCPAGLTFEGCCDGNTLNWCENNSAQTIACETGCGIWNAEQGFYDCFQDGDSEPVPEPTGTYPLNCSEANTEGTAGGEEGSTEGTAGGEEGGTEGTAGGEEGGTEGTAGGEEGGTEGTAGGEEGGTEGTAGGEEGGTEGTTGGEEGGTEGTTGGEEGGTEGTTGGEEGSLESENTETGVINEENANPFGATPEGTTVPLIDGSVSESGCATQEGSGTPGLLMIALTMLWTLRRRRSEVL